MLELTADNTLAYLQSRGWVEPGPGQVEVLAGGVSNQVLRVTVGRHCLVLKQSRPQLRTRDAWFADLERVFREQEVMQALGPLLPPDTVPRVLFSDRENFLYAMSHAPTPFRVWKENLLAGDIEQHIGEQVGRVLGKIHEGAARNSAFRAFDDAHVFDQLRIDPFYRRLLERRPEVAGPVARLTEEMLTRRDSLCHGDYTPKNMLVHAGGFTLVDYETAYFGDPTMDLGLCLCHVMLKAVRRPEWSERYFALTAAFWKAYRHEMSFCDKTDLETRGIAHFGACLLARIDGTSPVDYLPEEPKREAVRRMARTLLLERVPTWGQVLGLFRETAS